MEKMNARSINNNPTIWSRKEGISTKIAVLNVMNLRNNFKYAAQDSTLLWEPFQRLLEFQIHTTKTFDKPCGHNLSVSTQCCLKIPYPTKHNTNLMNYISTWTSGSAGQIYNNLRYCGMCYDSVHQARDANAIGCSTLTRLYSPPQSGTLLVELTWHLQQTNSAPRLRSSAMRLQWKANR